MTFYYNKEGNNLLSLCKTGILDFGIKSTNIPSVCTILVPLIAQDVYKIEILNLDNSTDNDNIFSFLTINGNDFVESGNVINTISYVEVDSTFYLHFFVRFLATEEYIYKSKICLTNLSNNEKTYIEINAQSTTVDENVETKLVNKRINIDQNWYTAYYGSKLYDNDTKIENNVIFEKYEYNEIDNVFLNIKKKEILLEWFHISAFVGSYKALYTILKHFGYGDLLSIKEYWQNVLDNRRKYTDITSGVITNKTVREYKLNIAKDFIKTNDIALAYRINQFEGGYDTDDGLPIYVNNLLFNTDLVLTKMYALKWVLENNGFIPYNIKIVDIIGEFDAMVGLNLRYLVANNTTTDVYMSENLYGTTNVKIYPKFTNIVATKHATLLYDSLLEYSESFDRLDAKVGVTKLIDKKNNFLIKKYFYDTSYIDLLNDFDILLHFDNSTYGLVEMIIENVDINRYFAFKIIVKNEQKEIILETDRLNITEIQSYNLLGMRNLGKYTVSYILFDYYGSFDYIDNAQQISILEAKASIEIATQNIKKYNLSANKIQQKTVEQFSTIETTNVLDNAFFDPIDSYNNTVIEGYYKAAYDVDATIVKAIELAGAKGLKIRNLVPAEVGYTYAIFMLDVCGFEDIAINGNKQGVTINHKYFEHAEYDTFTFTENDYTTPACFVTKLAGEMNKITLGTLADYTYSLTFYKDNSNIWNGILSFAPPNTIQLAQQTGIILPIGAVVMGFENGETDEITQIYGTCTLIPNSEKNMLTCTVSGILTDIVTINYEISFATKQLFGISTNARVFHITETNGYAETTNANYTIHKYGATVLPNGAVIVNDTNKNSNIFVF